jgi:LacI family transcriptional regulator, galactose operon repressor
MITMQNVADSAKVSRGTVSYVLNGKSKQAKISEATRDKIFEVAEKLGYRRNAIAQSMKTGKTNVIGFIGGLYSSYCMEIIKGINDVVSKNKYMIKLLPSETIGEVRSVARQCVEQRLAGVICRSLSEECLEILRKELEPNNIPIVLVDSSFSHNWCSRVVPDDFDGAKQAIEYLLSLGHSKIGHVTNSLTRGFAKKRYDGYTKVMAENGLEVQEDDICITSDIDRMSDIERNKIKIFIKQQKPTAIFCASDPLAMEFINIAHNSGIRIPEDLSIIGFGDLEYASFATPKLTTVKQPFVEMGRKTSEILLSEIKEKSTAKEIKLPIELIIRDSTTRLK